MTTITPIQIRGARAFLGWSLVDLAKAARVSVIAVKRAEDGSADTSFGMIQAALQAEGVCFLPDDGDGPGVRLRRLHDEAPRHGVSSEPRSAGGLQRAI